MHKLHGKRALVTAGAQGIGLATSRQLLAAGCDVFVHYRTSAGAARGLGHATAAGTVDLQRDCAEGAVRLAA
jgi:3-oxoacyl-[acyl-carrier protein] reductase